MNFITEFGDTVVRALSGGAEGADFLVLGLIFLAVMLALFAGLSLIETMGNNTRQRLTSASAVLGHSPGQVSLKRSPSTNALYKLLEQFEKHLIKTDEKERSALQARMIHAGYMGEHSVRVYYLARVVLAVSLPAVFLYLVPTYWPQMPTNKMLAIAGGLCAAGLYLPYRVVQSKIEQRQLQMTESFPDALDMMVVCVEAGLGFNAMLTRVSEQMVRAHPVLATLIGVIGLEIRAGKSRDDALRNFAARSGVADINSFVTLMIQSQELGADLSQTLKVQAEEMRVKRMLRAEEQAHKLPVKLSIPLVTCILPAMFAVVLGPGIVVIARDILPHLGN